MYVSTLAVIRVFNAITFPPRYSLCLKVMASTNVTTTDWYSYHPPLLLPETLVLVVIDLVLAIPKKIVARCPY